MVSKDKIKHWLFILKNASLADIWGFIQGYTLFEFYKRSLLPEHIIYQVEEIRMKNCFECLKNGECLSCGCTTPQKFLDFRACKDKRYPKMMNRWELYIYKIKNKKDV